MRQRVEDYISSQARLVDSQVKTTFGKFLFPELNTKQNSAKENSTNSSVTDNIKQEQSPPKTSLNVAINNSTVGKKKFSHIKNLRVKSSSHSSSLNKLTNDPITKSAALEEQKTESSASDSETKNEPLESLKQAEESPQINSEGNESEENESKSESSPASKRSSRSNSVSSTRSESENTEEKNEKKRLSREGSKSGSSRRSSESDSGSVTPRSATPSPKDELNPTANEPVDPQMGVVQGEQLIDDAPGYYDQQGMMQQNGFYQQQQQPMMDGQYYNQNQMYMQNSRFIILNFKSFYFKKREFIYSTFASRFTCLAFCT
jgi:hypothetical protein